MNRESQPTYALPQLSIESVIAGRIEQRSLFIPYMISSKGRNVEGSALADTGAKGKFIDRNFARRTGIPQKRLPTPIICYNVDGTRNKSGLILNYCEIPLEIGGKTKTHKLYVTGLGNQSIILGYPWFQENNPVVNWRTGKITLKSTTQEIKD